ncbi:DUF2167 domain-containing protein [Neogemmobacter tilapiae]|uniref:DUF2167 domain-containing protein n=1 Tax=Neogemmobacter tilapiae TaxID=875041 RepID=A0A918TG05_9RHOB|nr:DUF2167 domain-containing protein [Gemmobacter tilapiae]GHC47551.1 hypothetical protein GCM10007315_06700 [Gemmobacter tilapiae]
MRILPAILLTCLSLTAQMASAEGIKDFFPDDYAMLTEEDRKLVDQLDLHQGKVTTGDGMAELVVPEEYYFLDATDAQLVLEQMWGNPPDPSVTGMIFPRDGWAWSGSWGVPISYDPMGYVSDEDADSYDYDEMLGAMKADTADSNEWRVQNGYERITLVGWAEPPHYDKATKELYWAKHLQFEGAESDTLNYDIRELGRKGVLIVSFIAGMEQLPEVKQAAPDVLKMVSFTEGNRYADFQPGVDTVAAVGIGGLIAGKVAAKTGLLLVLLAFLKKGAFLLIIPVMWLFNKLRGGGNQA